MSEDPFKISVLCPDCNRDKEKCKARNYCLVEQTIADLKLQEKMWKEANSREWVIP